MRSALKLRLDRLEDVLGMTDSPIVAFVVDGRSDDEIIGMEMQPAICVERRPNEPLKGLAVRARQAFKTSILFATYADATPGELATALPRLIS